MEPRDPIGDGARRLTLSSCPHRSDDRLVEKLDRQAWPDELDAVVAAPAHHTVVLENDRVGVLVARVEPGDTVPLHTHRWPGVQYLVSVADFVRRDGDGNVLVDSRATGLPKEGPLALWSEPLPPHELENIGGRPIEAIVVELKERTSHSAHESSRDIPAHSGERG